MREALRHVGFIGLVRMGAAMARNIMNGAEGWMEDIGIVMDAVGPEGGILTTNAAPGADAHMRRCSPSFDPAS